ncbi:hypothetical protein ACFS5L_04400 [Streptomyces phyllanthi]|uniref:Uncharacterized protein n=1 Tax=Streptomyces phyllanthi TaxID=1803180 RepID=A0A5N8WGE8_9ACTN|nr:hypothetical protein [Streptomyces phyllanthi]MPY46540.1 hypothetical protein [Streptomyces phyllanthi]
MSHRIARLVDALLRRLFPGAGRHRLVPAVREERHRVIAHVCAPRVRFKESGPLRGEDHALIRPYLVAHERRQETRRHVLHGWEMTA